MTSFSFKNRLLVLRYSRLGRIPPALAAVQVLHEAGLPLVVIEFGRGNLRDESTADPIPRRRYRAVSLLGIPDGGKTLLDVLFAFLRIGLSILKEGRPRLIFSHGLYEQWLAYLLYKIWGIPYVAAVHEILEPKELSRLNRWFLRREGKILRSAEFLIFPEANRALFYQRRYDLRNPIHIVFNCPRLHSEPGVSPRSQWNVPKKASVLGYLGGIGRENFLEETIQAVVLMPNVYFLYWGWGDASYLERLKQLAAPAADRIRWMGTVNEEKWNVLKGWNAGLCLYRSKLLRLQMAATASNKLFECLSVGCPVVTTSAPDFESFLTQYPVGVAVKELTPAGISAALERLFADENGLRAKGEKGRDLFESHFHFEAQFERALNEFKKAFS